MKGNMHQYFGLIITCMFKYLDYAIIAIFTQNKALIYEWIPAIEFKIIFDAAHAYMYT